MNGNTSEIFMIPNPSKHFFIVAGEVSGDLHGARLMAELRRALPGCKFSGIGGDNMVREGLQSLVPLGSINVVGFWEVAKRYGFFRSLLSRCRAELSSQGIDAFIAVDYPGFNMRLATFAREFGIPVCWYIAPQLWAWGENRAKSLQNLVDTLLVVFPFEVDFFARFGINAHFVGHPLLDDPEINAPLPAFHERQQTITLLPGSREQELRHNLPLFLSAAGLLFKQHPHLTFSLATAAHLHPALYNSAQTSGLPVELTSSSRSLMRTSCAGIVKTGTSTLESALLGMPFVMAYKTSALTYWIARQKVTLPSIALANIITGKPIVQEYIQHEATPENVAGAIHRLLINPDLVETMQQEFTQLRHHLGGPGASIRAAEHIVRMLQ